MPPSVTSDKELIVEGKSFFTQHSYLFTRNKTIIVSDPKKYIIEYIVQMQQSSVHPL